MVRGNWSLWGQFPSTCVANCTPIWHTYTMHLMTPQGSASATDLGIQSVHTLWLILLVILAYTMKFH